MHTFNPHTKIESSKVNENFTDLSTGEGDTSNNSLGLFRAEVFKNFVDTGLVWSIVSGFNASLSTGVAYIIDPTPLMLRLEVAAITSRTFTASKDTYCDLGYDGVIDYNEVANGATAPTLANNHIRLAKVVTNGSAITSIVTTGFDGITNPIRSLMPLETNQILNKYKFHAYLGSSTTVNVGAKVPINTISYDHANGFSTANNRYVAPVSGYYCVTFTMRQAPAVATYVVCDIRKNGTTIGYGAFGYFSGGGSWSSTITLPIYLNSGDYVELFSASGGNYSTTQGEFVTFMSGFLISLV